MPTYSEALIAMESYFETFWDSRTPILFGTDDPTDIPEDGAFVRFNIRHTLGSQVSMGSPDANIFRNFGLITIQLFNRESNRGINIKALTNSVLDRYQGLVDSGVNYYNVRPNEVGNDGNGFYQTNVIIEFYYDNIT